MQVVFESDEIRGLVREIVRETLATIDWPANRITLSEAEAAASCGVRRGTLRDLRLRGRLRSHHAVQLSFDIEQFRDEVTRHVVPPRRFEEKCLILEL